MSAEAYTYAFDNPGNFNPAPKTVLIRVLDGARALLKKVEEQMNNVINKMKDGYQISYDAIPLMANMSIIITY